MVNRLTDADLCERVWEVLRERLGPVDTLRFLSLTRTQPRDYQAWRDERFRDADLNSLIRQIRATNDPTQDRG